MFPIDFQVTLSKVKVKLLNNGYPLRVDVPYWFSGPVIKGYGQNADFHLECRVVNIL